MYDELISYIISILFIDFAFKSDHRAAFTVKQLVY